MIESFIVANLWDLVDAGIDATLDQIHALGASGVSVVVTSGPVAQLRSAGRAEPRVFRSRGGFFFQPDLARYRDTSLKPIVSSWLKNRNPLDRIVEECAKRRLALRLRVSAFEVGRVAQRNPSAAGRSAWGDASLVTLCPANPDVRALLAATVEDLSQRYQPAAVELDDFVYQSGAFANGGLEIGFEPGGAFLWLLGLCFAEPSRQAAMDHDIDAAAALRFAAVELGRTLANGRGSEASIEELLQESDVLKRYVRHQAAVLNAILKSICKVTPTAVVPVLPAEDGRRIVPSVEGLREAGRVLVEAESDGREALDRLVDRLKQRLGPGVGLEIQFDAASESAARPEQLIGNVKQAADRGVQAAVFVSIGLIAEACLGTVKQAIRYASRLAP